MSLNNRARGSRDGGPPAWLIFLVVLALVLGGFYLLQGAQNYLRTGGLGVVEATERAQIVSSATAVRVTRMATLGFTPQATFAPVPECVPFRVIVPNAIVREQPDFSAPTLTSFNSGTEVCVLGRAEANAEWYLIDSEPETRRREFAYMHETVIEALNPTLTPTRTMTPLPTVTPAPPTETPVPSATLPPTPTPRPSATPPPEADSRATLPPAVPPTETPPPTVTPAPTVPPLQSA